MAVCPDLCDTCKNKDSYLCGECEHGIELLWDHYEESPEKVAEMEEQEKREAAEARLREEKELTVESITLPKNALTPEFREAFAKAKKLAGGERGGQFLAVYTAEDRLVSTDTYRIVEIYCKPPTELRGRFVVRLTENDGADLAGQMDWVGNYDERSWDAKTWIDNPDFSKIARFAKRDGHYFVLGWKSAKDYGVALTTKLSQEITEALWPIKKIGYGGKWGMVVFESDVGRSFLLPLVFSNEDPEVVSAAGGDSP